MRIGINIPDDLLRRMEPLRNVTNVSLICRNAIVGHVEAYERAKARAQEDGMNAIAERLGNSLVPKEIDWELLGIEDAKMWVQLAKLDDFEQLFHRLEVLERQGRLPYEVPIPHVQGVKRFEERSHEQDEWFDKKFETDEDTDHYSEAKRVYQRGKLSYILAVWEMAKKVANDKQRLESAARDKARIDARKQIRVPDRLLQS